MDEKDEILKPFGPYILKGVIDDDVFDMMVRNVELARYNKKAPPDVLAGDFVAGTMFAARYSVLSELFSVVEESDFSEKDNSSGDGRVPHALERMFTTTARHLNKKVIYVKE